MPDETRAIEPALTAEEWGVFRGPVIQGEQAGAFIGTHAVNLTGPFVRTISVAMHDGFRIGHFYGDSAVQLIALANAALPDNDPRKITRADVEDERAAYQDAVIFARWAQDRGDEMMRIRAKERAARHMERANRLAALLPPDDVRPG